MNQFFNFSDMLGGGKSKNQDDRGQEKGGRDSDPFKCTQNHINQLKQAFANMGMEDNYDNKAYKAAIEYTKGDINGAMDALLSSNQERVPDEGAGITPPRRSKD